MKKIFALIFAVGVNANAGGWFGIDVFKSDTLGIGASGGSLIEQEVGWYGSIKVSGLGIKDSKISYNLAKNGFGDTERGTTKVNSAITGGATFKVDDSFAFAAGVGFETITTWAEFYDRFEILGDKGKYYTEKDSKNGTVFEVRGNFRPNMDNNFSIGLGYQSGATGTFVSFNWEK